MGGGGASVLIVATVGNLPASATEGDLAFVTSTQKLYIYDNGAWVLIGGQGNLLGNAGQTAIASGAQTASIVFNTPMADTNYALVTSIENDTDATPIYLQIVSTAKSTTGFTFILNAPTDTAAYVINWQAAASV